MYGDGNVLTSTDVKYGGGAGYGALWLSSDAEVALDHVTFTENETCDVDSSGTVNPVETTYSACP